MYFVAQSHITRILIPYLLGFSACIAEIHIYLGGSNFSSMLTAELTKYNDLNKPMNMSPKKDKIVVLYSTLSPQKCTKLNRENKTHNSTWGQI
jgi:hypothetical protein